MKKSRQNKPQKPAEERKALALPLNAEEQAMVDRYRENERKSEIYFKIESKITPEATSYEMNPVSERGSDREKVELMLAQMCETFGTKNTEVADRLLSSCVNATGLTHGFKPDDVARNMNAILTMIGSLKPQDEIEAMLIGQLVSLHFQAQNYLSSSSNRELNPQIRDMHISRSVKLSRLFSEKLESLQRYRRKGEQRVIVQHVDVQPGARAAFVGEIHNGGRGKDKI